MHRGIAGMSFHDRCTQNPNTYSGGIWEFQHRSGVWEQYPFAEMVEIEDMYVSPTGGYILTKKSYAAFSPYPTLPTHAVPRKYWHRSTLINTDISV